MRRRIAVALLGCLALPAASAQGPYERETGTDPLKVIARFQNFNGDLLSASFTLPTEAVRESMEEFGFARSEVTQISGACAGCDQAEFDRRVDAFYLSRGMRVASSGPGRRRLFVDIAEEVRRNQQRLRSLTGAFGNIAKDHQYGPDDTLGAVVAFVQTAMGYQQPPDSENGRDLAGFYPPPRALEVGWGDCDTKSAVLAAVLTSFSGVRLIGVHVPKHYLIGVARVPRHGDAFIEWQGEPYVLVEAAGPAWRPPGSISDTTRAALQTMEGVRIDPMD
jgi:hypothetical protein